MEKYLQDVINIDDLKTGKINIIEAPCGSGKTTFAIRKLQEHFRRCTTLYLTDTVNNRESLRNNFKEGKQYEHDEQPETMSYALFGKCCAENQDAFDMVDIFLCDELSNCVNFSKIRQEVDDVNLHDEALKYLHDRYLNEHTYIIAIDATPQKIFDYYSHYPNCFHLVPLHGEPISYQQDETIKYTHINTILTQLDPTQRGLIYTPRIKKMKEIITFLNGRGITCNGIWSKKNEAEPMTKEQLGLRNYVLTKQQIPNDLNVLVINKSSERGINIHSQVDYVIVDDIEKDVQVQARGRIRSDIRTLYLKSYEAENEICLPHEYCGEKLYREQKEELCKLFNIVENGRRCGWKTIECMLEENGYTIVDGREPKGGKRYSIIM